MIVIGAKGHAKDLLSVLSSNGESLNLCLFDNVSSDLPNKLYDRFPILRSYDQVKEYYKTDNRYVIGVGNPAHRSSLNKKFKSLGGKPTSIIAGTATIGQYDVLLGEGLNIMSRVVITNSVSIGEGALINAGVLIHHDVEIGEYTEISPSAVITGNVKIGKLSFIGANATVLPRVKIGDNVIVGAGAVVTRDSPSGSLAMGVPARVIKTLV